MHKTKLWFLCKKAISLIIHKLFTIYRRGICAVCKRFETIICCFWKVPQNYHLN